MLQTKIQSIRKEASPATTNQYFLYVSSSTFTFVHSEIKCVQLRDLVKSSQAKITITYHRPTLLDGCFETTMRRQRFGQQTFIWCFIIKWSI